jgi:hypothetical protein
LRSSSTNVATLNAAGDADEVSLPVAACVAYLMPHVAASAYPPGWFHRAMAANKSRKTPVRRALGA